MKTSKLYVRLAAVMLSIAALLSLSSCTDDPYYSDLIGTWQLIEDNGMAVYEEDADYYTFYDDGTGYYTYYNRYGERCDELFYWDVDSGYALYLSYDNPQLGNTMCYYQYDGAYIYFSNDTSFYKYTTYARVY